MTTTTPRTSTTPSGWVVFNARNDLKALRAMTKQQVFARWVKSLGRVHNATLGDQIKAHMIYDCIRDSYGANAARVVFSTSKAATAAFRGTV